LRCKFQVVYRYSRYLISSHRDTPKKDRSGDSNLPGQSKAHREDPANEGEDILEEKAISDPKDGKEWCQRTNPAVFTWKKPCRKAGKVTYQDRHSTFDNSVRDAIR